MMVYRIRDNKTVTDIPADIDTSIRSEGYETIINGQYVTVGKVELIKNLKANTEVTPWHPSKKPAPRRALA